MSTIQQCNDSDSFECKAILYEAGMKAAHNLIARGEDPLQAFRKVIDEIHAHCEGVTPEGKSRIMLEDVPAIALIIEAKFGN